MAVFGWILDVFEDSSILTEKQRPKPKNSNSLKFFASFDTLHDPRAAKVKEISQFICFVLKFDESGALYNFLTFFKMMPRVSFIDLMVMKEVFFTLS